MLALASSWRADLDSAAVKRHYLELDQSQNKKPATPIPMLLVL
ncbi:hypothetical protein [Limosilactobacillus vaginalis]|nr:hypothetical protein [Limosilactobacillus vaginalis]